MEFSKPTLGENSAIDDAPDSPWDNGSIESFNARLRDELLDGEIFLYATRNPDRHRELAPSVRMPPSATGRPHRGVRAKPRQILGCQPRAGAPAMLPLAPQPTLHHVSGPISFSIAVSIYDLILCLNVSVWSLSTGLFMTFTNLIRASIVTADYFFPNSISGR